ncbi:MAG: hypothetical protein IJO48_00100 [Clostridia bacterium]|nr:hypothetical protein [Clostridia bacterium]
MSLCAVNTHEYEVDIKKLMERRLKQVNFKPCLEGDDERTVQADIENDKDMDKWCSALSRVLLHDLAHFELAKITDELPLELEEKEEVLVEAVRNSKNVVGYNSIKKMLLAHFEENDTLNAEGFIHFRMQDIKHKWEECVNMAMHEFAVKNEYLELMSVWASFAQLQPSRVREINVILHPDGSCTLTDDTDSRIDCERCTFDGIVSVLVGLAPEHITVYDMSGGQSRGVAELLMRVFEDRVRFYK